MSTSAASAWPPRQRRPPGLAAHWRDLKRRPGAWMVIARNLVPIAGVLALGWSRSLVVFNFWFDGWSGLVAIITAIVPRAVRESAETKDGVAKRLVMGVVAWVFMIVFLCLPYWVVLIPLHALLGDPEMWRLIRHSPGLWATFAGIALTQLVAASRRGYGVLPEREMKQALRWDAYLLILKAMGMFVLGANLPMVLVVPAFALLGTYLELWPANALGAVWGDPSRLYEDPAGGSDSPAPQVAEPRKRGKHGRRQPASG